MRNRSIKLLMYFFQCLFNWKIFDKILLVTFSTVFNCFRLDFSKSWISGRGYGLWINVPENRLPVQHPMAIVICNNITTESGSRKQLRAENSGNLARQISPNRPWDQNLYKVATQNWKRELFLVKCDSRK